MRVAEGLTAVLLVGVAAGAMPASTADAADLYPILPQHVIVVPDCAQNRAPIGLACIPRVASPDIAPSAVRATVDVDRQRVRRPYVQIFSWGP